jgi:hypothetical protein
MMLHESVKNTYTEIVIKEDNAFRLVLKKYEVLRPKGLFSVDLEQQCLKNGEVTDASVYNFFMTKEEIQALADGLTA